MIAEVFEFAFQSHLSAFWGCQFGWTDARNGGESILGLLRCDFATTLWHEYDEGKGGKREGDIGECHPLSNLSILEPKRLQLAAKVTN
jgi:hypothetical protein